MASVTSDYGWLHDAADLDDYITLNVVAQSQRPQAQVARRRYAGGRSRSVTRAGTVNDIVIEARHASRTEAEWIAEKVGRRLMWRSPVGGVVAWGFVDAADIPEVGHGLNLVDLRFTFTGVTGTAEV